MDNKLEEVEIDKEIAKFLSMNSVWSEDRRNKGRRRNRRVGTLNLVTDKPDHPMDPIIMTISEKP